MKASERQELTAKAAFGEKPGATAEEAMAITSHPLATRVAIEIMKDGGNACDATLGAAATQSVVQPHMTHITGVLSLLYYDAAADEVTYMNGNMNAPVEPMPDFSEEDITTGRGVGVPGFWAGFESALERHGSMDKHRLMSPAIEFAEEGFEVHPFLFGVMFEMVEQIGKTEEGRETYMPDGNLPSPGEIFTNPKKADVLKRLRDEGNDYFYHGEFADEFVDVVQNHGGVITNEDFEQYDVRWPEPAESTYKQYDLFASPPPDTGGTHVLEALNMIEQLDLESSGPPNEDADLLYSMIRIHNEVLSEGRKQRDPQSHHLPLDTLLSEEYAKTRLELLDMSTPRDAPAMGYPGSCHVTMVDPQGNVATALHSCMAYPWTNGLLVNGINIPASGTHFLRGEMPEPGHRPSTPLMPNMVFEDGQPVLASGSPGSGLVANVLQNTLNILEFDMDIKESVHRPRFGGPQSDDPGSIWQGPNAIEGDLDDDLIEELRSRGVDMQVVDQWNWHCGSFEGIHITEDGRLHACGDPRRAARAEGF